MQSPWRGRQMGLRLARAGEVVVELGLVNHEEVEIWQIDQTPI